MMSGLSRARNRKSMGMLDDERETSNCFINKRLLRQRSVEDTAKFDLFYRHYSKQLRDNPGSVLRKQLSTPAYLPAERNVLLPSRKLNFAEEERNNSGYRKETNYSASQIKEATMKRGVGRYPQLSRTQKTDQQLGLRTLSADNKQSSASEDELDKIFAFQTYQVRRQSADPQLPYSNNDNARQDTFNQLSIEEEVPDKERVTVSNRTDTFQTASAEDPLSYPNTQGESDFHGSSCPSTVEESETHQQVIIAKHHPTRQMAIHNPTGQMDQLLGNSAPGNSGSTQALAESTYVSTANIVFKSARNGDSTQSPPDSKPVPKYTDDSKNPLNDSKNPPNDSKNPPNDSENPHNDAFGSNTIIGNVSTSGMDQFLSEFVEDVFNAAKEAFLTST